MSPQRIEPAAETIYGAGRTNAGVEIRLQEVGLDEETEFQMLQQY